MTDPRVIGLDLSLTGAGISNGQWCQTIRSTGRKDATLPDRVNRLRTLTAGVLEYTTGAHLVVIEGPSLHSIQGHVWDRAGLWWRIVHRLVSDGVPVVEVAPKSRAKYATGTGNASKDEVLLAAARRWPACPIANNNEADACVLAAMGLDWLGYPLAPMPATHRAALAKVAWPDNLTGDTPRG